MTEKDKHSLTNHSYSSYIIVWLALLTFTAITVAVAGINFGNATNCYCINYCLNQDISCIDNLYALKT